MAIQDLPAFFNMKYTDRDGMLTPDSHLYNDQTFQALNALTNLVNSITNSTVKQGTVTLNGLNPPSLTTAQIAAVIADTKNPPKIGTIFYNSDMNKLQFLGIVGTTPTLQTISST